MHVGVVVAASETSSSSGSSITRSSLSTSIHVRELQYQHHKKYDHHLLSYNSSSLHGGWNSITTTAAAAAASEQQESGNKPVVACGEDIENQSMDISKGTTTSSSRSTSPLSVPSTTSDDDVDVVVVVFPSQRKTYAFIVWLAILVGGTDVICANTYNSYSTMMTGNTIRFAFALSKFQWNDMMFFGTMVICYIFGASVFRMIEQSDNAVNIALKTSSNTHEQEDANNSNKSNIMRAYSIQNNKEIQSMYTLSRIAPICSILFILADVLKWFFTTLLFPDSHRRYMLIFLSIPFGIINAAIQSTMGGLVSNAVTGHYTKVGINLVDRLLLSSSSSKWQSTSYIFTTAFIISIAIANAIYLRCHGILSVVANQGDVPLSRSITSNILLHLPPLGTTLGILYFALIRWYTSQTIQSTTEQK